jgi:DNA-binding transcriptional LysR family regulator
LERLVVALPLSHPLLEQEGPLSFAELAGEKLILYPRVPRLRRDDVVYRELIEQNITSPIIMSRRANDRSHESTVMRGWSSEHIGNGDGKYRKASILSLFGQGHQL